MKEVKSTSDRLKPAQEHNNNTMHLLQLLGDDSTTWAEKELNKNPIKLTNPLSYHEQLMLQSKLDEEAIKDGELLNYVHVYEELAIEEILQKYGEHLTSEEKEQFIANLEDWKRE